MNIKTLTTWLLVGYLAGLLSCGDALHRLPCFGHHHSSIEEVSTTETTNQCSCSFHATECRSDDSTTDFEVASSDTTDNHTCLICEFFDEYQASVAPAVQPPVDFPNFTHYSCDFQAVVLDKTPSVARGPPVA